MLIPSTITALRTRRYTSTLYIHHTIHGFGYNPMNDGGRHSIQSPFVSNLPPTRPTLSPPFTDGPFWGHSPSIWWPEDRAWCVATDIDLFDTYVGGSEECIEAVLSNPDLEALLTTLDARLDLGGDTINAKDVSGGCG